MENIKNKNTKILLENLIQNGKVENKYNGIFEIYPRKFENTFMLNILLKSLQDEGFKLYKMTNSWMRAMK
jgi:hypothetical protein